MGQTPRARVTMTRRGILGTGGSTLVLTACDLGGSRPAEPVHPIAALEADTGNRIGVSAVRAGSAERFSHREGERFAMCSTFKWLLGALVLRRVDAGEEDLARLIRYGMDDVVAYSPVTQPFADRGLTVGELCAATIETSDNTAANLLLDTMGGPVGFTQKVQAFPHDDIRLDRYEPMLNENAPGDLRDTTSPLTMALLLQAFLHGDLLTAQARSILGDWMIGATTGLARLRAGMPIGWTSGDKTGTSANGLSADVAFAIHPDAPGAPVFIASYIETASPMAPKTDALHAEIARLAFATMDWDPA